VFVIDLASRHVRILGSAAHPEAVSMQQTMRTPPVIHMTVACDALHGSTDFSTLSTSGVIVRSA